MKKTLITLSILLAAGASSAEAAVLTTSAAGELASHLADLAADETELTVVGPVNLLDLEAIAALSKERPALAALDLTDATILSIRLTDRDYFGLTYLPALELPEYIFAGTAFGQVKLPATLTVIGDGAFSDSGLRNISVPTSVTAIGDYAFYNCSQLQSASFGASLATLGKGCFANCPSLTSVNLASTKVTALPERLFAGCERLAALELPTMLESVGPEAFSGTDITTLSLSRVRKLEPFSLSSMPKLNAVALNAEGEQGEGLLAADTALQTVSGASANVPDAFAAGCSNLDTTSISSGASSLGQHALASTAAYELTLGENLATVSREAFSGMPNLCYIDASALGSNVPAAEEGAFDGIDPSGIKLLVKDEDQPVWKADPQWSLFNITSDPSTVADTVLSDSGISVRVEGEKLLIKAAEALTEVALYSLDGRLLVRLEPAADSVSLPLPAENAVIARASTKSANKTAKILLR